MVKGSSKLSKSNKNGPPKSQTRISAFFGRAPVAPPAPVSSAASDAIKPAPLLRCSPRKRPALSDVTGGTVTSNASPPKATSRPPPATVLNRTPVIIDLDDSTCELFPSFVEEKKVVEREERAEEHEAKENCLTGIAGRTSVTVSVPDVSAGGSVSASAGVSASVSANGVSDVSRPIADSAFGASETATPDGTRLVQRLTKRPISGPGPSPERKRPNIQPGTAAGLAAGGAGLGSSAGAMGVPLRRSPRKRDGAGKPLTLLKTDPPRRSPRKALSHLPGGALPKTARGSASADLERALRAGEAAAGVSAAGVRNDIISSSCRTLTGQIVPDRTGHADSKDRGLGLTSSRDVAASAGGGGVCRTNGMTDAVTPSDAPAALSGAPVTMSNAAEREKTSGGVEQAVATISPRKRLRNCTPEPEAAADPLMDSMADFFSSPFKEETDARPSVAPLRATDPSVPAWQRFDRYSVGDVERRPDGSVVLSLRAVEPGHRDRTVTLRGAWSCTRVAPGDVVHVLDAPSDVIDNMRGQLVVRPDRLISGTSVVSAVFCARKAVLSELFRGLEAGNRAMLVGTLVHQLFQEVMRHRLRTSAAIRLRIAELLRQNSAVSAAYGGQMSSVELSEELDQFVAPILAWLRRYTEWGRDAEVATPIPGAAATPAPPRGDEIWDGRVTELKDIEENFWSPRLGIKGKIDLTVEVKCRKRSPQVLPLELKTGRPSFSAEHQGQVTLYSMMTSERRAEPGAGLLLYLRTGAMREVAAGKHQQRDLLQLRNEMVHYLSSVPAPVSSPTASAPASSPAEPTDPAAIAAEPTAADPLGELELPPLPDVIGNERACQRCPHLVACTAYQRPGDSPHAVPDGAGHLSASHLSYFLHWTLLLRLEMAQTATRACMSRLWCRTAEDRQTRGQALASCRLLGVTLVPGGGGTTWEHRLMRPAEARAGQLAVGDLVMISTGRQLAVCMGSLTALTDTEATVLLDRDLTTYPGGADELYHIDKCEYQAETSTGTYFSSLARLMENSERSRRLRELIIDRRAPSFLPGLGRLVITKCRAILRPLNKLQQRALLRVMMAEDYLLIQGMPGTGKTSTIVALVRLLVTMGRSVLLASYTHSAVDTVLLKLKEHFTDFVRLGRAGRVHPDLRPYCAETLTQPLATPEDMAAFYDSKPVVATTCLGTNHPVFQRRKFDICIIDEASQIVQPAAIAPALLAERFVLVGDPEQLPPVIQSSAARRRGMDRCLFSRLAPAGGEDEGNTVRLTQQYRMNGTLTAAANHLTYGGRLTCGSDAVRDATLPTLQRLPSDPVWLSAALDPAPERSLLLLDTSDLDWRHTSDKHGAVSNATEATLVAHIAAEMVQRGMSPGEVGVIAPYRGQVRLLRAALPAALEVNTVDQYQGRDKSVILYSCTRTAARRTDVQTGDDAGPESDSGTDILSDQRRLTVAITRAKHKLVLVGRSDTLRTYPPFGRLLEHLHGEQRVIRLTAEHVSGLVIQKEVNGVAGEVTG